jgi:hypothetical protein
MSPHSKLQMVELGSTKSIHIQKIEKKEEKIKEEEEEKNQMNNEQ